MSDPNIKYTGKPGEYHPGIAARDLTTADYDALDNEHRATVRASAIYAYSSYRDAVKAPPTEDPTPEEPAGEPSAPEAGAEPATDAETA